MIRRLDEFAASVNDRLTMIDFTSKREIIRALVKRIEIHKEEVVIVFRVDPDPGFNKGEGSTDTTTGKSIMQDRKRSINSALRCSLVALNRSAVRVHQRCG